MSAEQQLEKEIREAIVFLREKNQTIPSDTIEFMKQASLEKLENIRRIKTYYFDCWDRTGKMDCKRIEALDIKTAKIIFESEYPNLGYDEPYC